MSSVTACIVGAIHRLGVACICMIEMMFQQSTMFTDADSNDDTKSTSLLANMTDGSCRFEYIEIVPLPRDTDGPHTTDSGDWSAEVKQENLPVVKQEPEDVCHTGCVK